MRISPICIYCKSQEKPFNREHVIPEAFGTFEQNLILHDCVCVECNSYFGRDLDFHLARDSVEAILRLRYGLKSASEARELRYERLTLRIRENGPWYGAQFVQVADASGARLAPEIIPQVGFRKKSGGEWIWLTEKDLQDPRLVDPYRKNVEITLAGPSNEVLGRLRKKLEELGINFRQEGVRDQPVGDGQSIQGELETRIDEIIFRGIAKIALNYVAYVRNPEFVLRIHFDPIREFVRFGKAPGWLPVIATQMPILADDSRNWRQTNGHLLVLDWNKGREGLVVLVSLFNHITYHVLICKRFEGLWHPLESGHHFDLESRCIQDVIPTKLIRPPW